MSVNYLAMAASIVNDLCMYFLIGVVMGFRETCKQSIFHNDNALAVVIC